MEACFAKAVLVAQATCSSRLFSVGCRAAEAKVQGDEERPSASDGQGSVTHLSTVGVLQSGRPVYAEDEEAYG